MYDDLLGEKKKKLKGIVVVQDCEWDDEKKELKTTNTEAFEVEIDEDGNISTVDDIEIEPSQDIAQCNGEPENPNQRHRTDPKASWRKRI